MRYLRVRRRQINKRTFLSSRSSSLGQLATVSRISTSEVLPSQPLHRLLGLMLRFICSAIADSVAFMMAANGGYDVTNTRPEPARGPAGGRVGLLGSEQHYPA